MTATELKVKVTVMPPPTRICPPSILDTAAAHGRRGMQIHFQLEWHPKPKLFNDGTSVQGHSDGLWSVPHLEEVRLAAVHHALEFGLT